MERNLLLIVILRKMSFGCQPEGRMRTWEILFFTGFHIINALFVLINYYSTTVITDKINYYLQKTNSF